MTHVWETCRQAHVKKRLITDEFVQPGGAFRKLRLYRCCEEECMINSVWLWTEKKVPRSALQKWLNKFWSFWLNTMWPSKMAFIKSFQCFQENVHGIINAQWTKSRLWHYTWNMSWSRQKRLRKKKAIECEILTEQYGRLLISSSKLFSKFFTKGMYYF